jgi:hypothetical protein
VEQFGERKSDAHPEFHVRGGFFSLTSQELNIGFCRAQMRLPASFCQASRAAASGKLYAAQVQDRVSLDPELANYRSEGTMAKRRRMTTELYLLFQRGVERLRVCLFNRGGVRGVCRFSTRS